MRYLIRGGELIDGGMQAPLRADLLIDNGIILAVGRDLAPQAGTEEIDATGLWVTPGLQDAYAAAQFAGSEPRETIASAAAAAAAGGYSRWNLQPTTDPVLDSAAALQAAQREAAAVSAPMGCIAALTLGNAGKQLSPLAELAAAGAIAFSDGGKAIGDVTLLRHALAYSASFGLPVLLQPEDVQLAAGGLAHEGAVSLRLGLPGIPAAAESSAVARLIALAELTGARLHLCRISSADAVAHVRAAQQRGVAVSASVTAHHLLLDERWLLGSLDTSADADGLQPALLPPYDSSTRVTPPLRSSADRAALRAALADGTISVLASDHRPRARVDVDLEYGLVKPGISSLETTVSVGLTLAARGLITPQRLISALTDGPAQLYQQPLPRLAAMTAPGLTLLAPRVNAAVNPAEFRSRGRNTPLRGQQLIGQVRAVLSAGRLEIVA